MKHKGRRSGDALASPCELVGGGGASRATFAEDAIHSSDESKPQTVRHRLSRARLFAAGAIALSGACTQHAAAVQWAVTVLHPIGSASSRALATDTITQAGSVSIDGLQHASVWSGSSVTWQDLHPPGASSSYLVGVSGSSQVGNVIIGASRASLWNGTPESRVDLQPSVATLSYALDCSGNQQVGIARVNSRNRASLWHGTADSWVDLHPSSVFGFSEARGTSGTQQVGFVHAGASYFASLWSGSAESWVNLSPFTVGRSFANAVHGDRQAGQVQIGGFYHASLWTGTAESWLDLNPEGASESFAYSISGDYQAGRARIDGEFHAGIWSGSAQSWIDLHSMLPASFQSSIAHSVWSDGIVTQVAGSGYNIETQRDEAVLWTIPAPPAAIPFGIGIATMLVRRKR